MPASDRKQNNRILPVITAAVCAFLAIGVMTLFPACGPKEDGSWMSCHYAQLTVCGIAILMTVMSAAAVFVKKSAVRVLMHVLTAACAIFAAVIPGNVIHLCMMNEMQCRAVMRPAVILVCVVIIVLSVICMFGKKRTDAKR